MCTNFPPNFSEAYCTFSANAPCSAFEKASASYCSHRWRRRRRGWSERRRYECRLHPPLVATTSGGAGILSGRWLLETAGTSCKPSHRRRSVESLSRQASAGARIPVISVHTRVQSSYDDVCGCGSRKKTAVLVFRGPIFVDERAA